MSKTVGAQLRPSYISFVSSQDVSDPHQLQSFLVMLCLSVRQTKPDAYLSPANVYVTLMQCDFNNNCHTSFTDGSCHAVSRSFTVCCWYIQRQWQEVPRQRRMSAMQRWQLFFFFWGSILHTLCVWQVFRSIWCKHIGCVHCMWLWQVFP